MSIDSIAERLVRNHPRQAELLPWARQLGSDLIGLGDRVPPGSHLLLGGSIARGEPCVRRSGDGWRLLSDLDMLLVHETPVAPAMPKNFDSFMRERVPDADIMTLSEREFSGLGTSLGFDFKENGILLSHTGPLTYAKTEVDARDAREILAYTIFIYFWSAMGSRWGSGEETELINYDFCRLSLKALRTVIMIRGGYSHHFTGELGHGLDPFLTAEMAAHDSVDDATPLAPARLFDIMAGVFDAHDAATGGGFSDAVTGTRYEGKEGSEHVILEQRLAFDCMRRMVERHRAEPINAGGVVAAERDAWAPAAADDVLESTAREHFVTNKRQIQKSLLRMKLPVV